MYMYFIFGYVIFLTCSMTSEYHERRMNEWAWLIKLSHEIIRFYLQHYIRSYCMAILSHALSLFVFKIAANMPYTLVRLFHHDAALPLAPGDALLCNELRWKLRYCHHMPSFASHFVTMGQPLPLSCCLGSPRFFYCLGRQIPLLHQPLSSLSSCSA